MVARFAASEDLNDRVAMAAWSELKGAIRRLLLAGLRPSGSAVATTLIGLHLSLLGDLQRVVTLDSRVSDRASEFAVTEQ